jgi:glycosidase
VILFELNARVYGKRFDQISEDELRGFAELGFDWIWLMGIWQVSPAVLAISKRFAPDFFGSPYAIAAYEVSRDLGGEAALRGLVERAHAAGLRVMADFVPNHLSIDSPLIDAHPEWVIHSNPSLREEHAVDYFDHPKGRLAHGKDPHFSGWVDTVQLDYAHPGLRAHMASELARIAALVDGVRCDMAMLVLRDQVKRQWFPGVSQRDFDAQFPVEFWPAAIKAARAVRSDFVLMAEVYWDKEAYLQELGFDYTYDKKLYDLLAHHRSQGDVTDYLRQAPSGYLARSVHFLENHDEERAAARFGKRARPAALLSFAIPGVVFMHQGQMEGFREKLPVQRVRPLHPELPDARLMAFYTRLLDIIKEPVFREGGMTGLPPQSGLVLFVRRRGGQVVLVGADISGSRPPKSPALTISLENLGLSARARLRCVDLWTGEGVPGVEINQEIRVHEGAIASFAETGGFLLDLVQA